MYTITNTKVLVYLNSYLEKFYSHANGLHSVPLVPDLFFPCFFIYECVHAYECKCICAYILLFPLLSYRIYAKDEDRSLESWGKQFQRIQSCFWILDLSLLVVWLELVTEPLWVSTSLSVKWDNIPTLYGLG